MSQGWYKSVPLKSASIDKCWFVMRQRACVIMYINHIAKPLFSSADIYTHLWVYFCVYIYIYITYTYTIDTECIHTHTHTHTHIYIYLGVFWKQDFLDEGSSASESCSPGLLRCKQILYHLSHQCGLTIWPELLISHQTHNRQH